MTKHGSGTLVFAALVLWVGPAASQPPRGQDQRPGQRGGPPRFELGRVLPPQARQELNLTREQEADIVKLEKEVKERLEKILTSDQKKKLDNLRLGPPGGGPNRPPEGEGRPGRPDRLPGEGRPGGRERPPEGEGRTGPPKPPETGAAAKSAAAGGGIQWFATWESGLREARRSHRPILLVSAAPHCAGVSGIW